MKGLIYFLVFNKKKLSSHMDQISQNVNTTNHKIHFHDQMSKIIASLGINE